MNEGFQQLLVNMNNGIIDLDSLSLLKDKPQPSLWGYYYTLPKWAREDNFVRNTMMALEYHQPSMTLRQKEQALNLACSFLRPIDKNLMATIAECATSNKIQLNMERGNQMLNELEFIEFDHETYGDGDLSNKSGNTDQQFETLDDDDEKGESPMQAALRVLNEDERLDDKRKAAQAEMNIDDYKVEPMSSECMSDFLTLESN